MEAYVLGEDGNQRAYYILNNGAASFWAREVLRLTEVPQRMRRSYHLAMTMHSSFRIPYRQALRHITLSNRLTARAVVTTSSKPRFISHQQRAREGTLRSMLSRMQMQPGQTLTTHPPYFSQLLEKNIRSW